jgi:hypothetical protein
MMANPKPGDFPAFDFGERAIMISYPYRPDFALQELKSQ